MRLSGKGREMIELCHVADCFVGGRGCPSKGAVVTDFGPLRFRPCNGPRNSVKCLNGQCISYSMCKLTCQGPFTGNNIKRKVCMDSRKARLPVNKAQTTNIRSIRIRKLRHDGFCYCDERAIKFGSISRSTRAVRSGQSRGDTTPWSDEFGTCLDNAKFDRVFREDRKFVKYVQSSELIVQYIRK